MSAGPRESEPTLWTSFARADGSVACSSAEALPIYSLTKTFIAALVMSLGIDVRARVSNWIEPALLPHADAITVEQLLQHTSGVRDYGPLPAYHAAVAAALVSGGPAWSDAEFARRTLQQPLLFAPGDGWNYSNAGFWLLARIAERAAAGDLATLVQRCIAAPLGLSSLRVATGAFASRLPNYDAGWVWHGLLIASCDDVRRFLASELIAPLAEHLVAVPGVHAHWRAPHYGYGLMVEPGVCMGHNGDGPVFHASGFRWQDGRVGCVVQADEAGIAGAQGEDAAMLELRRLAAAAA